MENPFEKKGTEEELSPEEMLEKIPAEEELQKMIDFFGSKGMETEEFERFISLRKKLEAELASKGEKGQGEKEIFWRECLKDLGKNITMEVHLGERAGERVSIYREGKYVGDIISNNNLTGFTDKEFQDKAYDLLYGGANSEKAEKPRIEANADEKALGVMAKTEMFLEGEKLILQRHEGGLEIDLYGQGENKSVEIETIDEKRVRLVVTEKSGKIIEYIIDDGVFLPDSRKVRPPKDIS